MNFIFPPLIQAGISSGAYEVVRKAATGQAIGVVRNTATGQFAGHAVAAVGQNVGLLGVNPALGVASVAGHMATATQNQMMMGQLKAIQAGLGVLQTTTALIGVGTVVTGAIAAVNLWQTMKLRREVREMGTKIDNGFLDLKNTLISQNQEVLEQLDLVAQDVKFEQHKIELIKAYSKFLSATQLFKSALSVKDTSIRNSDIANARQMLREALGIYQSPYILDESNAPGYLRRVECAWQIEQTIALTYSLQDETASASHCIEGLRQNIRHNAVEVMKRCQTQDELDFVFPELLHVHDNDLPALELWQAQLDWVRSLPPEDKAQLQAMELSEADAEPTELAEPPAAIAQYETFKAKSHFDALRDQIVLMMEPQEREKYVQHVSDRAKQEGHTALVPRHLNLASEFAIANLFYYFTLNDESLKTDTINA